MLVVLIPMWEMACPLTPMHLVNRDLFNASARLPSASVARVG
jgi:hypothetical protein